MAVTLDQLWARLGSVGSNVQALLNYVPGLISQISSLGGHMSELDQSVQALQGAVTDLSERIGDNPQQLAAALTRVQQEVRFCVTCYNVAEAEQCRICRDPRRSEDVLCVVEEPKDVVAIERTREFRGRYHVLGGAISPIDGVGPDDLRVKELMTRLMDGAVTELIIATDPNLEGEATAAYLARLVSPMGLAVSRLASGLPVGGDLEYADEVTLGRAFEGRRRISA